VLFFDTLDSIHHQKKANVPKVPSAMHSLTPAPKISPPLVTLSRLLNWAQSHYRDRTFSKDERIPTRPGLLYWVEQGAIRLVGLPQISANSQPSSPLLQTGEAAFLGLIGAGQPFEIVPQSLVTFQAYAQVERTSVIWLYWHELENWPHFHRKVFETFHYQHQRKLLWLSILGQKRAIDRLLSFLVLLGEEQGELIDEGCCLSYPVTHAQIASAIGATRVTVTRLMVKLRQQGLISIQEDNLICLSLSTIAQSCSNPLFNDAFTNQQSLDKKA
jgi:hypothetical protein